MKTRTVRAGMAAATAATLLAGVTAATAEDAPASTVSTISTQNLSNGLRVSGNAALAALEGVQVAEDPAGDTRVPGADIVGGTITPLGGGVTRFTMEIGNMGPTGASLPAVMHHSWDLAVVNGEKETAVTLKGINRGAAVAYVLNGTPLEEPSFGVQTCVASETPGAPRECSSTYVTGAFTEAGMTIDVPNTLLGLQTGSVVYPGTNGMYTNPGASDLFWFSTSAATESVQHDEYVVPDGDVKVGVAPAGTAVDDVVLDMTAPVRGKAYSATLPKPEAGDYVVVVQACHDGLCGPRHSKAHTVR